MNSHTGRFPCLSERGGRCLPTDYRLVVSLSKAPERLELNSYRKACSHLRQCAPEEYGGEFVVCEADWNIGVDSYVFARNSLPTSQSLRKFGS